VELSRAVNSDAKQIPYFRAASIDDPASTIAWPGDHLAEGGLEGELRAYGVRPDTLAAIFDMASKNGLLSAIRDK
jgi:hypothetical protein